MLLVAAFFVLILAVFVGSGLVWLICSCLIWLLEDKPKRKKFEYNKDQYRDMMSDLLPGHEVDADSLDIMNPLKFVHTMNASYFELVDRMYDRHKSILLNLKKSGNKHFYDGYAGTATQEQINAFEEDAALLIEHGKKYMGKLTPGGSIHLLWSGVQKNNRDKRKLLEDVKKFGDSVGAKWPT